MIRLRTWHLDETGERRSFDWEVLNHAELDALLDSFSRAVAAGALINHHNSSGFLYAFPASRFLLLERLPQP